MWFNNLSTFHLLEFSLTLSTVTVWMKNVGIAKVGLTKNNYDLQNKNCSCKPLH